jgi:cytochrome c-type protein NapB
LLTVIVALAVVGGLTLWWAQPPAMVGNNSITAKTMELRAARRAYDGAPPVIPHPPLGAACQTCHTNEAREVPGVGLALPNPHLKTVGLGDHARCQQCHVFQTVTTELVANRFAPLTQSLRAGERLYSGAPPVIPHHVFMREDCNACHAGAAARPEIRCSHPERLNCMQCHAAINTLAGRPRK